LFRVTGPLAELVAAAPLVAALELAPPAELELEL